MALSDIDFSELAAFNKPLEAGERGRAVNRAASLLGEEQMSELQGKEKQTKGLLDFLVMDERNAGKGIDKGSHRLMPEEKENKFNVTKSKPNLVETLMRLENDDQVGFSNGRWTSFESTGKNKGKMKEIGYGIEITPEEATAIDNRGGLTQPELMKLFKKRISKARKGAKAIIPNFNKLSKERQDAFTNMTYQMGTAGVKKFKNMIDSLRGNPKDVDWDTVAYHMRDSDWFNEQTPGRAKEVIEQVL